MAAALGVTATLIYASQSSAAPVPGVLTEYVALGDSYVAGPGIPPQNNLPTGCGRSGNNYPSLVNTMLRPARFRDVSCRGARTANLTAGQSVRNGGTNPAQVDSLTERTDLVTVGIGGNDIGFGQIVHNCGKLSPTQPGGAACRDHYIKDGADSLSARIMATAPKVDAVLAEIRRRAPHARVLLVGYPTIVPDTGPGCYPAVPFSPGDVEWLRQTEKALNAMLAERAGVGGVTFVDTYTSSIGHDICQVPDRKWMEGLVPTSPAAPVHPNAVGMRNSAAEVVTAVQALALAGR